MLEARLANCGCVDFAKTAEVIKEVDTLSESLKKSILEAKDEINVTGTSYFVSQDGCDDNDGLSPDFPIKTVEKVNSL